MVYQNVEHCTKCSKCWHTIIFNIFLTCSTFLKRRFAKFNIFKCWFSYDISLNPCFKVVQIIVARSIPCLHIPSSYNIPYLKLNNQTFGKKVNFWLNIWYHSQHLVCTNMRVSSKMFCYNEYVTVIPTNVSQSYFCLTEDWFIPWNTVYEERIKD